jgi:S-adenosylmethionine:tRNA ribosyltransferase-isomerase
VYSLQDGSIIDGVFYELDRYLPAAATIVVNNSKVDNCRWLFNDGRTEIFVLEKTDTQTLRALVRPGRKFKTGSSVALTEWLHAEVLATDTDGIRTLRLNVSHDDRRLKTYEHIPLPPYIDQNDTLKDEYQTVYAKPLGSMAAPTAGLHFTEELLNALKTRHDFAEITLHVGLGTFAKLQPENLASGRLHEEHYQINQTAADILSRARHITAVGTTTIRTLESARRDAGPLKPQLGTTDIFIRPGYHFQSIDSVITNFHLPGTSLLMLVAAFIADKRSLDEASAARELQRIYQHAITNRYRFYSFGDAMLLV